MNVPAALTWMHLLADDVALVCDRVPGWLQSQLAAHGGAGPERALVTCDRPVTPAELQSYDGVVAINCPRLGAEDLGRAGFGYVRRFGIVPGIAQPRWFIPLDGAAISAGAFSLYKPARLSGRLKHFIIRTAARSGLPLWYRDELCVARRTRPAIEDAVQSIFPDCDIRLALSSGPPDVARNRKPSAMILGTRGQMMGFAKLAKSPITRNLLKHEAQVLAVLARRGVHAPRLLFAGEVDGTYVTVQSPLSGRPVGPKLSAAHRRFLDNLRSPELKPAAETELAVGLADRIDALPSVYPELQIILSQAMPQLQRLRLPATIVHGDFGSWNLRRNDSGVCAFDWEYAHLDGLPLLDEIHCLLLTGRFFENWSVQEAYHRTMELAGSSPLGLGPYQVRALAVVYLLDIIVRLFGEGYDRSHDMVCWLQRLLEEMAGPFRGAAVRERAETARPRVDAVAEIARADA